MPKQFTLTAKRIEALRFIRKHPDCFVGAVAQQVLVGPYRMQGGRSLWQQQATRAGAGYCQALQRQGLVAINTRVDYGYGSVRVTPSAEQLLDRLDESDEANSLAEALQKSQEQEPT